MTVKCEKVFSFRAGVDLAGIAWGRMASAEGADWGEAWEGVSSPSRLGSLGERCELPSGVQGRVPAGNGLLAYFEGNRTLLYVPTV